MIKGGEGDGLNNLKGERERWTLIELKLRENWVGLFWRKEWDRARYYWASENWKWGEGWIIVNWPINGPKSKQK